MRKCDDAAVVHSNTCSLVMVHGLAFRVGLSRLGLIGSGCVAYGLGFGAYETALLGEGRGATWIKPTPSSSGAMRR
eukprot:62610-Rhodomonas_salina.1